MSKLARRISVWRSASGDGPSPACSQPGQDEAVDLVPGESGVPDSRGLDSLDRPQRPERLGSGRVAPCFAPDSTVANPGAEIADLVVRERTRRGHLQLARLLDRGDELAVIGTAGYDGNPALAAFHGRFPGIEGQAAGPELLVMAGEAARRKDWPDPLLEEPHRIALRAQRRRGQQER